ncbi:MAG: hypothetical protein ACPG51_05275 [Thiolinea sp.]
MLKISRVLILFFLFLPVSTLAFAPLGNLKVESEWGNADPKDVKAVLDSANQVISAYVGSRSLGTVIVRNDPKGPISLYERGPANEYIVLLDVKGRYWAQLAYQFAHEMCHLLTNYDLAPNNVTRQQWFEESICEAFSLFVLERMAEQWAVEAPYPNWKSYARELKRYAESMLKQEHRTFAPDLSNWYRENKQVLEDNPYAQNRRLNEKFASHILDLLNRQPGQWAALNYLNLGANTEDRSLSKYLNDWYQNAPAQYQQIVVEIQQLVLKN